jgi:hypothetical protein
MGCHGRRQSECVKTSVAAIALGVSERRIRELVVEGKLPGSLRIGRKVWHVPAAAVFARLRAQTSGSEQTPGCGAPTPSTTDEGNDA